MALTIFGTGYVGLVTGAYLAKACHAVVCVDVDQGRIDKLKAGTIPIWPPGLEPIVTRNVAERRLRRNRSVSGYAIRKGFIFPTWPNCGRSITTEPQFYRLRPVRLTLKNRSTAALAVVIVLAFCFRAYLFSQACEVFREHWILKEEVFWS